MATVKINNGGRVTIPTDIRKKYHIEGGTRVTVNDENGVITIRPTLNNIVKLAKKSLKKGA